jgi:large subunit ribosomal protein L25
VLVEGDAAPGTLVNQETNAIEIEADVQSIPEQLTVSVEGSAAGTQITAADIELPEGVTLISDPELLVINVIVAPTEEDLEADGAGDAVESTTDEATGEEISEEGDADSESDSESASE